MSSLAFALSMSQKPTSPNVDLNSGDERLDGTRCEDGLKRRAGDRPERILSVQVQASAGMGIDDP